MKDQVEKILTEKIRPMLQADGGDIELVAVEGKRVKVKLKGACAGCPGAAMTLKMGVEQALKEEIPELEGVDAVE
jgi:Fe-S cluster biogenesis protein NfuA